MKTTINTLLFSVLLFSCGTEQKEEHTDKSGSNPKFSLITRIAEVEKKMHASPQIDKTIATQALQLYYQYATTYPKDSITPDYYFKSGEINTALGQYPQAYANYQIICERFPKYELIEESYFLQASALDHHLNQDESAKVVYEDLLKKFPGGKYTADARAAINNLGKSDADLIKEFQSKNAGK